MEDELITLCYSIIPLIHCIVPYPNTILQEMNSTVTSYNSPGCRQATDQSLDQCVNVKGFNYTNLLQAFYSNNTDVYMPLLNRYVNILCGSNACRDALINVYRSCHSDELVSVHCRCVCVRMGVCVCVYVYLCVCVSGCEYVVCR